MAYLGLGRVSEGFIPSECLQLVPDVGFQWLCGEPVHPDVMPLLATSKVENPVVNVVAPERDVVAPDGTVLQEGTNDPVTGAQTGDEYRPGMEEIRTAGFGVMGVVTAILLGLATRG